MLRVSILKSFQVMVRLHIFSISVYQNMEIRFFGLQRDNHFFLFLTLMALMAEEVGISVEGGIFVEKN